MKRSGTRAVFGLLLGVLLAPAWFSAASAQGGAAGDTTRADSLAAPADTLAAGDSLVFHPSVKLGYRSDRDYSTLNQSVQNVTFRVGDRLRGTTGATSNQKKSRNISQRTQNRSSTSNFTYELFPSVSLVSNLLFSANENRTSTQKRTVSNDNFDLGTAFEHRWNERYTTKFDVFAGTVGNKNAFYESRGNNASLKTGLVANPWTWFSTTLDYDGSRGGQTSRDLDSGGETDDESREQNLNGRFTVTLPEQSNVVVTSGWDMGSFQRPDTLAGAGGGQETKTLRNRSLAVSATLLNVDKLTLNLDGDWARRLTDFVVERDSYVLIKDKGGKLGTRYKLTGATEVGLSYSDRLTRSVFRPDSGRADRTGDTVFRSVNASMSQRLGTEASVELSGKADLQQYKYDDPVSFPEDRDVLDQRLSMSGNYRPFKMINMQCEFSVLDRRTVNIEASRSSNNNRAQTYSLRPTFTFTLGDRLTVAQRYSLDATYTEFSFDDDKNTVARSANLNSAFNYNLTPRVKLSLAHDYRDTDQGRLRREGDRRLFARSSQNERQEMNVTVDYAAASFMKWSVQQRLQIERRWSFDPTTGDRKGQPSTSSGYFTGKVDGRVQPWPHFTAGYQAALNLGRGDRIPTTQKRYWTASVDVTYTY